LEHPSNSKASVAQATMPRARTMAPKLADGFGRVQARRYPGLILCMAKYYADRSNARPEDSNMLNEMGAVARRSPLIRLFTVGFLALLLQVPVILIAMLVSERRERRTEAVKEVSSKWGGTQALTGPVLVVPYRRRITEAPASGGPEMTRISTGEAVFLPERLELQGKMTPEIRRRGIFSIPV